MRSDRTDIYGGLIDSYTEPPKSKFEMANTEDHGYVDGVRASYGEREKVATHLRQAFTDGRLVESEYDARVKAANAAITQRELTGIARDLPAPKQESEHRISRTLDSLEETEKNHPHAFHIGVQSVIFGFAGASSIPFMLFSGHEMGSTAWPLLPVFAYIIATIATVFNIVTWIDG